MILNHTNKNLLFSTGTQKIRTNLIIKIFFILLFLELFLIGSGQYFNFGGITLRMILFAIAVMGAILIVLIKKEIEVRTVAFLLTFFSILSISSLIGIVNGANILYVVEDLKPLIYFIMIIPLVLFIKSIWAINLIVKIIKFSGIFMALLFVFLLLLLQLGYIDFETVYATLSSPSNDFMMAQVNGYRIFYKGFFYLNIAFLFYLYGTTKDKIIALFLLFAIFLTFTRGFLLALVLALILMQIIEIKKKKSFYILLAIFIGISIFIPTYMVFIGDRSASDGIRYQLIEQVYHSITPISFFIGHGLGIGIDVRPIHMEISYMEIFHKQGIIGLFFWLSLPLYMIIKYTGLSLEKHKQLAKPFLASIFFVYTQSLTNPLMTNPLGIGMILISFATIVYLNNHEKKEKYDTANNYRSLQ